MNLNSYLTYLHIKITSYGQCTKQLNKFTNCATSITLLIQLFFIAMIIVTLNYEISIIAKNTLDYNIKLSLILVIWHCGIK